MPELNKQSLMLFKITPDKFTELTSFVDCDQESLIVLTPVEEVSCGAVFQKKSILEILFEEFGNSPDAY